MKNIKWLFYIFIALGVIICWYSYQKVTDETYEGMTIIPEEHDDIPLFEGLEPTRNDYIMDGNHWEDIYDYYLAELPKMGWEVNQLESALDDPDTENDWSGFFSTWRKEGFDGELSLSSLYNTNENKTEVKFDQFPVYHSTEWISGSPESICLSDQASKEKCKNIKDEAIIQSFIKYINDAIDWDNNSIEPRSNKKIIEFDNLKVEVLYEEDKEIYFRSEKGIKLMKPEPEFLKLIEQ